MKVRTFQYSPTPETSYVAAVDTLLGFAVVCVSVNGRTGAAFCSKKDRLAGLFSREEGAKRAYARALNEKSSLPGQVGSGSYHMTPADFVLNASYIGLPYLPAPISEAVRSAVRQALAGR